MSALIFSSQIAAVAFVAIVVAFFVCEQVGGVIIPRIRRGGAKVERKNVGSNMLVLFSWVAVFGFSAPLAVALLPDWLFFFGVAVMIMGLVFRQWAIAVLGRYFSTILGVQTEQKVVTSGPYRWIRHPSYTGVLIFLVGWGLALQSGVSVLANIVIFAIAYGSRILFEERVLVKELGSAYVDYMKHTKRLVPHLI
jgi:protein-S-isoprenylcysteine O-methyltransferase Ste14